MNGVPETWKGVRPSLKITNEGGKQTRRDTSTRKGKKGTQKGGVDKEVEKKV